MKLKKSERKLLEKRRDKLEKAIVWAEEVEAYDPLSMTDFDAKFLTPSARYLSKVVDSLIYTRLDFVNKDGSEIGPACDEVVSNEAWVNNQIRKMREEGEAAEKEINDGVACHESLPPIVTEVNLVVG